MIRPGETAVLTENVRGFATKGQEVRVQDYEVDGKLRVVHVDNPNTPFYVPRNHVRQTGLNQSVTEKIKAYADEIHDQVEDLQVAVNVRLQEMLHDIVEEWGHEIVYELATNSNKPLSYHLGEDYAELAKVVDHLFKAQMILDKLRNEAE